MSRAVSVTTKIVRHAKAVMSVMQAPMTAALVFSGTAFLTHATAHIDSDKPACETRTEHESIKEIHGYARYTQKCVQRRESTPVGFSNAPKAHPTVSASPTPHATPHRVAFDSDSPAYKTVEGNRGGVQNKLVSGQRTHRSETPGARVADLELEQAQEVQGEHAHGRGHHLQAKY